MSTAEHENGAVRETPDRYGAFPRLTPEQLEDLTAHGERRRTAEGEVLYREGEPFREFLAILSGTVEILHDQGGPDERTVAVHGPGRFLGELGLLEGQAAFNTAVVREAGEILAVPVERQRALVGSDPVLGDLILRAYLGRRYLLIGLGAGFRILGSCYSRDTLRLREFAARNRLPHRWVDLERDKEAEALLRRFAIRPEETPVVLWQGERLLRNPSNAELARLIGLPAPSPENERCDVMVVGAGPAGLAAAVYGASDGLTTVTVDAVATGGQAATSSRIENYLGFPSGISGGELIERAVLQAHKFGARLMVPAEVSTLTPQDDEYVVTFTDGSRAGPAPWCSPRECGTAGSKCPASTAWKASASTTRRRSTRPASAGRTRSPWSAAGTPPGKRRCSSPNTRPGSTSSSGAATSTRTCRATWWTRWNSTPRSRCCSTPKYGASPGRRSWSR
ncbi:Ferredoxin--NADP reductase [Streptomyces lavendulae subsp. lavendulae]